MGSYYWDLSDLLGAGGAEDLSQQHSAAAAHSSTSPYGSAERSFRNQTEATEEAALTRQVTVAVMQFCKLFLDDCTPPLYASPSS